MTLQEPWYLFNLFGYVKSTNEFDLQKPRCQLQKHSMRPLGLSGDENSETNGRV